MRFPNLTLSSRYRSRGFFVALGLGFIGLGTSLRAAPVINEIMFRPGAGYPENPALEFIELHNPDTSPVDLSGWALTKGADFTFPAGTSLPAGGFLVVAADPAALRAAGATGAVVGPWLAGARLSNRGEKIELAKPGASSGTWSVVDEVTYADEGDWAVRTRDELGGWSWVSGANDGGKSLERRNPKLAVNNGQNWGASNAAGGSPGRANSLLASNIAPVISRVKHAPAVPTSNDPVTIECMLTDEAAATTLAATLFWRNATSATPGPFQSAGMVGDGTGRFAATVAALPDKSVVEFYIAATDGTHTRTWPAPTSEGQNANATYQVDNEVIAGTAPVYRLVLTGAENAAYEKLAAEDPYKNRQFNLTFIATRGQDSTIRYLTSMRIRGQSSRFNTPKALHVSLPTDDRWEGVSDFNLNPRYPWLQFLGMRLIRAAGLAAADVTPIEVRRNGIEYDSTATSGGVNGFGYGRWVRVEDINGDYADRHWPDSPQVQVYRKEASSFWKSTDPVPTDPDTTWSGWSKQNQQALNDWSDVVQFSKLWQEVAASHFTGAEPGNVQSGTWNKVPFSDAEIARLSAVVDFDQIARWFAVMTVIQNTEPNISNGGDDDYAAAFVSDGTRRRLQLVPHDMDNIFGQGEEKEGATAMGLYPMSEVREGPGQTPIGPGDGPPGPGGPMPPPNGGNMPLPPGGNPGGPIVIGPGGPPGPGPGGPGGPGAPITGGGPFKALLPLFGDKDNPGNAAFRQKYLTAIRELLGTIFDADASGGATPAVHAFVDNNLAGWVPDNVRAELKSFMTARQAHLLGLIGAPKITPAASTTASVTTPTAAPTLRINEVLAFNRNAHANGALRPDAIELFNAGTTAVSLAGKSLTDDPAVPAKFVFPAGTSLPAGGHLVVYADAETSAPGLHAGFSLDTEGDQVRLHDTAASGGALLDAVTFGFQIADYSVARTGATGNTWALTTPTIGAANGNAVATGNVAAVRINEWSANVDFRTDHEFIELYNTASQPVALAGARLTDDPSIDPERFAFPPLSFIAPKGFLPLYGADFGFGLDADADLIFLLAENGTTVDFVDNVSQPADTSTARTPDGGTSWKTLAVPTPGISNETALPAAFRALLDSLRITEVHFQPTAPSNAGDYEFVELQNTGSAPLDLGGVRFTNGIDYVFPSGTTLAPGAFIIVAKNRTAFTSRYPNASGALAPGQFTGALDNSGETLALTLPEPWYVHILRFRYEADWQPLARGGGHSLVVRAPALTAPRDWSASATWRASSAVNGTPGTDDSAGLALRLEQGSSIATVAGSATTLSVRTAQQSGVTYQWQKLVNGAWVNIPGATTASYTIVSTQSFDATSYRALVTANGSTFASDITTVSVAATAATPSIRLANLSTRAMSLTGASAVVPGFVIGGSGPKRLLVRGVGPGLVNFGVAGVLSDPHVALKRWNATRGAYEDVTANDQWHTAQNAAEISATAAAVGAFPLGAASTDAALVLELPPGQYSAVTSGAGGGTGVVLVEVYDADSGAPTSRMVNLASRAFVGTGENVISAGFVVTGAGTKTLLVRAVGPTLASFGVSGVLADPRLAIYRGSEVILANDDWSTSTTATGSSAAAAQVGAFALPAGSKDAAFVVTLPAGAYTVQVAGADASTGIALVEIYEVP